MLFLGRLEVIASDGRFTVQLFLRLLSGAELSDGTLRFVLGRRLADTEITIVKSSSDKRNRWLGFARHDFVALAR